MPQTLDRLYSALHLTEPFVNFIVHRTLWEQFERYVAIRPHQLVREQNLPWLDLKLVQRAVTFETPDELPSLLSQSARHANTLRDTDRVTSLAKRLTEESRGVASSIPDDSLLRRLRLEGFPATGRLDPIQRSLYYAAMLQGARENRYQLRLRFSKKTNLLRGLAVVPPKGIFNLCRSPAESRTSVDS
jgi:hypothetical protein